MGLWYSERMTRLGSVMCVATLAIAGACRGHEAVDDWEARARAKASAAAVTATPAASTSAARAGSASVEEAKTEPDATAPGKSAHRRHGPAITSRVEPPRAGRITKVGLTRGVWRYVEYEVGAESVELRFRGVGLGASTVSSVRFDGTAMSSWDVKARGSDLWVFVVVPRVRFVAGVPVSVRVRGRGAAGFVTR